FPLPPESNFLEPLATLSLVAGVTERVKLGTTVLVLPHRHPVLTAKAVATLDHLSGGRVILGAGVGWMREEIELLGAPFDRRRGHGIAASAIRSAGGMDGRGHPRDARVLALRAHAVPRRVLRLRRRRRFPEADPRRHPDLDRRPHGARVEARGNARRRLARGLS